MILYYKTALIISCTLVIQERYQLV